MRYRTIVADPPWQIERVIQAGGRRARTTEVPYAMLSLRSICALPIGDLADDNAHLYLWATRRVFREGGAVQVARAWGFRPVGEVIWGCAIPAWGRGRSPMTTNPFSSRCVPHGPHVLGQADPHANKKDPRS